MAIPESYADEGEFMAWMHDVLHQDKLASILGWTVNGGQYQEAVDEALAVYGEADITTITGIRKLRQIGRVELWRLVAQRTVGQFAYSAIDDGSTYQRQQIHEHAVAMMKMAIAAVPSIYRSSHRFGSVTVRSVVDWR